MMHDISEVVKKEHETQQNETSNQESEREEDKEQDKEIEEQSKSQNQTPQKQGDIKTECSSNSDTLSRTKTITEQPTDAENASRPDTTIEGNETRIKFASDKMTTTAVKSILPPEELEEENIQSTSPVKDTVATATKTTEKQPSADGASEGNDLSSSSKPLYLPCR